MVRFSDMELPRVMYVITGSVCLVLIDARFCKPYLNLNGVEILNSPLRSGYLKLSVELNLEGKKVIISLPSGMNNANKTFLET
ncbi:hypothetical protein PAPYR_13381 [Paratrimastix pyriformis]|uniref:Uncharacterized protein n=1 Tax=Paratrimastix pyriformis TaxID=342808 RepID=A0ABQ8U1U0_9EUKA|nr:hypothetical protein PAPYR_13381 [Paratrimastix pyriformis]